jgi:hypothetical protein
VNEALDLLLGGDANLLEKLADLPVDVFLIHGTSPL